MKYLDECGLLTDEHYGFRRNRPVVGLMFTLHVILDCAAAAAKREAEADERYIAIMADIREAYPRTMTAALYDRVAAIGIPPSAQRIIYDLNALAQNRMCSSERLGAPFQPERGLKEGDATSCPLFNLFHTNAAAHTMRTMKMMIGDDFGIPMRHFGGVRLGRRPRRRHIGNSTTITPTGSSRCFSLTTRTSSAIFDVSSTLNGSWWTACGSGASRPTLASTSVSSTCRLTRSSRRAPPRRGSWARGCAATRIRHHTKRHARGAALWRKLAS